MATLMSGVVPAPGYGVPGDAVPAALPPAVSGSVLPQDTAPFKSEAEAGPGGQWPQQTVPSQGQGAGWEEDELDSPVTDLTYMNPDFTQGPWPWSEEPGEPLGTVPDDGINTYRYPVSNKKASGFWERNQVHPGNNLLSQNTDTAGWQVNVLSGRTAVRRLTGQSYPGVDPYWLPAAPRPAVTRVAAVAVPLNGHLAEYGDVYNAGGNLAYAQPPAPAVSDISQVYTATGDSGLNTYGSF
jgi:hypothetical protein